ncbi:MAG: ABC transporter ATP-binding protein/permease [Lachnospiraceae bacterium]|jgi:ATP-binding cassette subfamily B protein|nr:ABC transporter ATP-binding protein/permease [Lachnospiraceae bacterium]MCI1398655.1 ABC transporter ATP-binding protein/permease [Lachnospiraceae bacterium]MCI1424359.1 ABC transporter ATP-binding protein/permease [Lachnospiraceae bacterium]MCI1453123.1 ABC transporter ATP-binding protein/permease [Lachnospiraceae bacterium]MDD5848748.1 ABC transporter ATP-binding protein [Bacillota bacterium]
MQIIQKLMRYIGRYKLPTILTPIFTLLEVLMEILIPYIIASIIDKGISAGNMNEVVRLGIVMLIMAFASLLFGILAGTFAAGASSGFAANLREAMYENIQTFSFSNIDKFSTAGLVTRMTTDVTNIQNAFQMTIRIAVRAPLMMIISLVMCVVINPHISLIFLVALFALAVVVFLIIGKATHLFRQMFRKYDDLNASVEENVSAIRVVKAFVREDYETQKFGNAADNLYRQSVAAQKLVVLNFPVMMLVVDACMVAISWVGAHYILGGTMTTGELTSIFSYVMNVLFSLMMLAMIFVMISMSAASAQRIVEVLEEVPSIQNPKEPVTEVADGSIEFHDVDFSYMRRVVTQDKNGNDIIREEMPEHKTRDEETLHNLNFSIRSGETIGIIGGTGSGKTSLVALISRLYDVTHGCVKVGGRDVRDYDLTALRDEVSVVLQNNVLFSGSILDNLRWGNENATLEDCKEACQMACADEFIDRMPEGYETQITQGGTNVSGGQKQRLCIARALMKKPKILILDDSTSACDTATDAKIRSALRTAIPGTTKLIIAQRISSVQDCDRILVLDGGTVNAFDTHEHLLATNRIYSEIYESQIRGGGDFDRPQ